MRYVRPIVGLSVLGAVLAGGTAAQAGTYDAAVLADAPKAYFRLDEQPGAVKPTDSIYPARRAGYSAPAPDLGIPGLLASDPASLAMNVHPGQSAFATEVNDLNGITAQVSLEAIVKPTSEPMGRGEFAVVAGKGDAFFLQFTRGAVEFKIVQPGGTPARLDSTPNAVPVDGKAHHLVGTYDGQAQRLYIDGVLAAEQPLTGPINEAPLVGTPGVAGLGFRMGARLTSSGTVTDQYDGVIDEVAVYDHALSAQSVAAHQAAAGLVAAPSAPAAPTNLAAAPAGPTSVALSWNDVSGDETGFTLQRSTEATFATPERITSVSLGANAFAYTDTGLTSGTTYFYRVAAVKGSTASDWSGVVSATPRATTTTNPGPIPVKRLKAPRMLRPRIQHVRRRVRVDLRWRAVTQPNARFQIQRTTNGRRWTVVTLRALPKSRRFIDTRVQRRVRYTYRIRVVRGRLASVWSNRVTIRVR